MADPTLSELHCYRCIYTWTPRRVSPRMCPRCKSQLWNVPRIRPVRLGHGLGVKDVLGRKRAEVLALLREYGVKEVRVFGSLRRQEATDSSDVDLLVDSLPGASLLDVARLKISLQRVVGRPVDVVEIDNLPWAMRPQVEAEAVLL